MEDSYESSLLAKRRSAIRSSWDIISESLIGAEFAQPFYDRLFDSYPDVRPMFENASGNFDLNEQAEKFFHTVGSAVDYLNNPEGLREVLEDLGRKVSCS